MTKVAVSPDGYIWQAGDSTTDDHLALGGHEPALGPVLQSLLYPYDGAYINIGAHVGTWAIRMAKYATEVFAVEANPKTVRTLLTNIELNHLDDQVFPIRAAIWDRAFKKINLVDVNGKATGGSTRVEPSYAGMLETTTLDIMFLGYEGPINLISMDVEGAEAKVLEGGRGLLEAYRPNLLIEVHDGHPGVDKDLRDQLYKVLTDLRYRISPLHTCPPEEHWICTPLEVELDEPEKG